MSDLIFFFFFICPRKWEHQSVHTVRAAVLQSAQYSVCRPASSLCVCVCVCVFGSEQRPMICLPVCAPAGRLLGQACWTIADTHTHKHTQLHLIQSRVFTAGLWCWLTATGANNLCLPPSGWMRWVGWMGRWRGLFSSALCVWCGLGGFCMCGHYSWCGLVCLSADPLHSSSADPASFTKWSV